MSAQHTPGPWIWSAGQRGLFGAGECNAVLDYAYFEGMHLGANAAADAALIAAAPDLLAACRDVDTFFVFFDSMCPPEKGEGARQALMNVKAAILKSTGGAS